MKYEINKDLIDKLVDCANTQAEIVHNSWVVSVCEEDGVGRIHLLKADFVDYFGKGFDIIRKLDKGTFYIANNVNGVEVFCICFRSELEDVFGVSDEELEELLREEEE